MAAASSPTKSNTANIVIVDTGCANLSSVQFAVEKAGFSAVISDDIATINAADKVILPGVGSAKHAMENIRAKGLVQTLQQLTQPTLGFCLGMQLMTESSEESATGEAVECLGLIPTQIKPLAADKLRLPHMGWNTLTNVSDHPVFNGIEKGDYFYFVHSFGAPISDYTVASCEYGNAFSAAIAKGNFIGCQFHPERSSKLGSTIIKNFLTL